MILNGKSIRRKLPSSCIYVFQRTLFRHFMRKWCGSGVTSRWRELPIYIFTFFHVDKLKLQIYGRFCGAEKKSSKCGGSTQSSQQHVSIPSSPATLRLSQGTPKCAWLVKNLELFLRRDFPILVWSIGRVLPLEIFLFGNHDCLALASQILL
jgi:hypothetical protein